MSSVESGIDDLLHFPLGFSFYNFWWGLFVVWSVCVGFPVSRQEVYVEDRVDTHRRRERQPVRDW